ncbi:GH25 family lysozyme [Plantibacter sp. YIM 135249]|uniref:GH25 family lysozyme n=1 Tax=Plantibacter sp. YIM 135249 TaxID=3423918 RepID=UPI003D335EF1
MVALGTVAILIATGVIWPNQLWARGYEVRGVDVSSYQGTIDWNELASQDIDFAYIKSTEGSGDQDEYFAENWKAAQRTGLLVGAYHFFSFESPGETQAENIISTVPKAAGALPIVVDVEFYKNFAKNPPKRELVRSILDPLLQKLEAYYGVPPILYATETPYELYLSDAYPDNPIWIRNVATPPTLSDGRAWTIWQFSNRDRLTGYSGKEEYIDMNVFDGSLDELKRLTTR